MNESTESTELAEDQRSGWNLIGVQFPRNGSFHGLLCRETSPSVSSVVTFIQGSSIESRRCRGTSQCSGFCHRRQRPRRSRSSRTFRDTLKLLILQVRRQFHRHSAAYAERRLPDRQEPALFSAGSYL